MRNAHGHIFVTSHLQFSPRLVCAEVTLASRRLIRDTFMWLKPRGAMPPLPNLKSSVRSDALHVELEMKTRAELAREFAEPRIRSEQQLQNARAEKTSSIARELWPGAIPRCCLSLKKAATDENGHATLIKQGVGRLYWCAPDYVQAGANGINAEYQANQRLRRSARAYSAG
jgi:hypothetical protein